ncbi:MAG: amidohydrolase family protein [Alphaproteobacteria bacterium]|nr:amidohydrolase family protein [Alphaproteobacteria bacterium]
MTPSPTDAGPPGTDSAPLCAPPDPNPRAPTRAFPAKACDCHAHICGPADQFDYAIERIYTPPDALPASYLALLETLGIERAVLVQPSVYGTDNTVLLAALERFGEKARGVAVVADGVDDAELARLHALGVRGVRLNLVDVAEPNATLPLARARALADRIRPLGWHMELLIHVDGVPDLDAQFADFPVDLVFGHLGYVRPGRSPDIPGFQALLRLMAGGRAWVKLTGPYRISRGTVPYGDTDPFARALFEAAPDHLVWGSDWPHVMVRGAMPNDGDLCDLLCHWAGDDGMLRRVLVDNPQRLYGFTGN